MQRKFSDFFWYRCFFPFFGYLILCAVLFYHKTALAMPLSFAYGLIYMPYTVRVLWKSIKWDMPNYFKKDAYTPNYPDIFLAGAYTVFVIVFNVIVVIMAIAIFQKP